MTNTPRLAALLTVLSHGHFLTLTPTSAKVVRGTMKVGENWAFVTRFCFLSNQGRFTYEANYPVEFMTQNIDLYYDTPTQWDRVYGKGGAENAPLKTCRDKESVLQVANNQFINLTDKMEVSGCHINYQNSSKFVDMVVCEGTRNFNTARERWWFVAISNCNSTNGLEIR